MKDKDLMQMVPPLKGRVQSAIATETGSSRSQAADDLAATFASVLEVPVESVPDPAAALARARDLAGPEGAVLVTGSLYLVGAIRSSATGKQAQRNEGTIGSRQHELPRLRSDRASGMITATIAAYRLISF